ncbi:TrlF family AAA-like ATPase [Thioalkalivibrio paradoxus]|uniref:DNA repair ATPase n=1 Tax=Thioalkalivibrio paradoxus ARh 1 TaxID=713585 RepID=W0DLD9_9GAMM|nr:AAA family ATPase [Thioalkalivibrio paradoxus]AHE98082.1 DNA repair ATPase [Thioalkalivibrio paradoxus ARh 1]
MAETAHTSEMTYTKARFIKCALQVNPADYIRYRGQQQTLSEDEYNQQLLEAALEAGVEVIGVADHGSVAAVDRIRGLFSQHGIVVFPGFEIASSEKVHFVCLFDESTATDLIKMHMGALKVDFEQPEVPVYKSAIEIIDYVNNKGGFIYAAHVTNDDGVLKRRMNHVWKHENLRAAQIPGSIGDLKGVEGDFYRQVLLNKNADYRRQRPMAAINAADVCKPEQIKADGTSCLIKMSRPCFASFKQAFSDPESRVRLNSDRPEHYASAIEGIRFVGGYLDEVDIEFSDHLNALIGGRGTGKSTLLECIRFALDLRPFGQSAQKQHDAVIKANLGLERGRVELFVRSAAMHGRHFQIKRRYGDQSVVLDEEGNVSPHQPHDLLPGLDLFGQNEIHEMTRDRSSRNKLMERFLDGEQADYDATIAEVLQRLKENRESIVKALQQREEIEADVERLPKLQDQARQFQALGLDEKLKVIPRLEKERRLNSRGTDEIDRLREAISGLKESLPDTTYLSDAALEGLPHAAVLRRQKAVLDGLAEKAWQAIVQLEESHRESTQGLAPLKQEVEKAIKAEEQKLEAAFKEIPASQGKTGRQIGAEYQALLQRIERIQPKQAMLQSRKAQIDGLYSRRKKLLLELSEASGDRAAVMQKSLKRLNRRLDQKVRLILTSEGDREPLFAFLSACDLEGVGPKRLAWVKDGDFSAVSLAEKIRTGAAALQQTGWGVTPGVAEALCRLPERKLLEMEELLLPDLNEIELNVTHGGQHVQFRPIDDLSTGQQCTAVLHLLLLGNQDPLILDQPEDNLDNAFIAERIVSELRNAKLTRQFIFATHNANIPVFGDAEWIGVLSVEEGKGRILPQQQGAIDLPEIQHLAADILEGGEAAFNQRREKYGFE